MPKDSQKEFIPNYDVKLSLNLCDGGISLQASISWSAYINVGILGLNKTFSAGRNYSYPGKNLAIVSSLVILKNTVSHNIKHSVENKMAQELNLNESLINQINYSLSFSLNNGILSVKRVSHEPLWKKIVLTGLFFIPTIGFLLAALYCIYAATVTTQYANNCSEALPFLILITVICLTAIPSISALYSSKSSLDSSQYSFVGFFVSKRIPLENRKPILTLEIYDSPIGGLLEGKIRIRRKRNFLPWDIHVFLFQTITYPSKEIAHKNARIIKEYISKNANSIFEEIKIEV